MGLFNFGGSAEVKTKRERSKSSFERQEDRFTKTFDVRDESRERRARATDRLKIDQAGIDKIIADVLGASGSGLAAIFAGEKTAGIFDSSVAAQAAGDLAANVVGEIAKLTAERVQTEEEEDELFSIFSGTEDVDIDESGSARSSTTSTEKAVEANVGISI